MANFTLTDSERNTLRFVELWIKPHDLDFEEEFSALSDHDAGWVIVNLERLTAKLKEIREKGK